MTTHVTTEPEATLPGYSPICYGMHDFISNLGITAYQEYVMGVFMKS